MVASERAHATRRVLDAIQPQRGQHERRGPALGPGVQQLDVASPECDAIATDEQLIGLVDREREVTRAELVEGAAPTQVRQWQTGVDPREQDHARIRREMTHRVLQRTHTRPTGHVLQLVEDQHDALGEPCDSVHRFVDHVLDRRLLCVDARQRRVEAASPSTIERRPNVSPQDRRVVVGGVESHPRDPRSLGGAPRSDRSRLAIASRGRHQREP